MPSLFNSPKDVIWVFHMVLSILAIIFNGIGLLAIYLSKKKTTQSLILSSLSIWEMLVAISHSFMLTATQQLVFDIAMTVTVIAMTVNLFNMFYLTIDRLICVINPIKHKDRVTRSKMVTSIVLSWPFAIVIGVLRTTVPLVKMWIQVFILIFAVIYMIVVVITYVLVIVALRKSRYQLSSNGNHNYNYQILQIVIS